MRYLVCQDWENTTDNHAGMKHMCNLLKKNFPDEYEIVILKEIKNRKATFINKVIGKIIFNIYKPLTNAYVARKLLKRLNPGDEVYLLEYMEKLSPQLHFAKIIKKHKPEIKVAGLIHLTPHALNGFFSDREIEQWTMPLDMVLTFGSSLTKYLVSKQIPASKIKTFQHYVDLDYYHKSAESVVNENNSAKPVNVIAMGNQRRNYDVLYKIMEANAGVHFTLCKGVHDIDHIFSGLNNVTLIGFVEEDVLKGLMNEADISLNVMYDTVGSNVITTSLAMGLAVITSDVGSIRDYCDESDTIFCNNEDIDSFSNAIFDLSQNREKLTQMKRSAINKARNFNIKQFHTKLKF